MAAPVLPPDTVPPLGAPEDELEVGLAGAVVVDAPAAVEVVVATAEPVAGTVSGGAPVVSGVLEPPVLPQPAAARARTIPPTAII